MTARKPVRIEFALNADGGYDRRNVRLRLTPLNGEFSNRKLDPASLQLTPPANKPHFLVPPKPWLEDGHVRFEAELNPNLIKRNDFVELASEPYALTVEAKPLPTQLDPKPKPLRRECQVEVETQVRLLYQIKPTPNSEVPACQNAPAEIPPDGKNGFQLSMEVEEWKEGEWTKNTDQYEFTHFLAPQEELGSRYKNINMSVLRPDPLPWESPADDPHAVTDWYSAVELPNDRPEHSDLQPDFESLLRVRAWPKGSILARTSKGIRKKEGARFTTQERVVLRFIQPDLNVKALGWKGNELNALPIPADKPHHDSGVKVVMEFRFANETANVAANREVEFRKGKNWLGGEFSKSDYKTDGEGQLEFEYVPPELNFKPDTEFFEDLEVWTKAKEGRPEKQIGTVKLPLAPSIQLRFLKEPYFAEEKDIEIPPARLEEIKKLFACGGEFTLRPFALCEGLDSGDVKSEKPIHDGDWLIGEERFDGSTLQLEDGGYRIEIPPPSDAADARQVIDAPIDVETPVASTVKDGLTRIHRQANQLEGVLGGGLPERASNFSQGLINFLADREHEELKTNSERIDQTLISTPFFLGYTKDSYLAFDKTVTLHGKAYERFFENLVNFIINTLFFIVDCWSFWRSMKTKGDEVAERELAESAERAARDEVAASRERAVQRQTELARELEELDARRRRLRDRLDETTREIDELAGQQEELRQARRELETLQEQLRELDEFIEQNREQHEANTRRLSEIDELEPETNRDLEETQRRLDEMNVDVDALARSVDELRERVGRLESDLATAETNLRNAHEAAGDARAARDLARTEVEGLQREAETQRAAQRELGQIDAESQRLESERQGAASTLSEIDGVARDLSEAIDTAQTELDNLRNTDIPGAETNRDTALRRRNEARQEAARLRQSIQDGANDYAQAQQDVQRLNAEIDNQRGALNDIPADDRPAAEGAIAELEAERNQAQQMIDAYDNDARILEDRQRAVEQFENQLSATEQTLSNHQNRAATLEGQIAQDSTRLSQYRARSEFWQRHIEQLEGQLSALEARRTPLEPVAERLPNTESQLGVAEGELARTETQLETANQEVANRESERDQLSEQLINASNQLRQDEATLQAARGLQVQIDNLNRQLDQLAGEREALTESIERYDQAARDLESTTETHQTRANQEAEKLRLIQEKAQRIKFWAEEYAEVRAEVHEKALDKQREKIVADQAVQDLDWANERISAANIQSGDTGFSQRRQQSQQNAETAINSADATLVAEEQAPLNRVGESFVRLRNTPPLPEVGEPLRNAPNSVRDQVAQLEDLRRRSVEAVRSLDSVEESFRSQSTEIQQLRDRNKSVVLDTIDLISTGDPAFGPTVGAEVVNAHAEMTRLKEEASQREGASGIVALLDKGLDAVNSVVPGGVVTVVMTVLAFVAGAAGGLAAGAVLAVKIFFMQLLLVGLLKLFVQLITYALSEIMNKFIHAINNQEIDSSQLTDAQLERGKKVAISPGGCGQDFFHVNREPLSRVPKSLDPDQVQQELETNGEAAREKIQSQFRGAYHQYHQGQRASALAMFRRLALASLDHHRLDKLPDEGTAAQYANTTASPLESVLQQDIIQYEKSFEVTDQKKFFAQLSGVLDRVNAGNSTSQDLDARIDWTMWCVAWVIRIYGFIRVLKRDPRGAATVLAASAIDFVTAFARAALVATYTTDEVLALQYDVVCAEAIVFESVVGTEYVQEMTGK